MNSGRVTRARGRQRRRRRPPRLSTHSLGRLFQHTSPRQALGLLKCGGRARRRTGLEAAAAGVGVVGKTQRRQAADSARFEILKIFNYSSIYIHILIYRGYKSSSVPSASPVSSGLLRPSERPFVAPAGTRSRASAMSSTYVSHAAGTIGRGMW